MVDLKYCEYAQKLGGVQIAALQAEFNLTYRQAKNIVDDLVSSGYLAYDGGLDYRYVKMPVRRGFFHTESPRYGGKRNRSLFDDLKPEKETETEIDELFKKLKAKLCDGDGDDVDEEENYDIDWSFLDDDNDETDDNPFNTENTESRIKTSTYDVISTEKSVLFQRIHDAAKKLIEIKSRPVCKFNEPDHSLWDDEVFNAEILARIEKLVLSDKSLAIKGAIKKMETCLEAVRDTHDRKMVQLYENIVYRLKSTSGAQFNAVRKRLIPPDGE